MNATGPVYTDPGSVCTRSLIRARSDRFCVDDKAGAGPCHLRRRFAISTIRAIHMRLAYSIYKVCSPEHFAPSQSVQRFLEPHMRSGRCQLLSSHDHFLTLLSNFEILACDLHPFSIRLKFTFFFQCSSSQYGRRGRREIDALRMILVSVMIPDLLLM